MVGLTREMREVKPPLYGPTGGSTWVHCESVVMAVPPLPPSATYRLPSGPNVSPRGLLKPVAKTETLLRQQRSSSASTSKRRDGGRRGAGPPSRAANKFQRDMDTPPVS